MAHKVYINYYDIQGFIDESIKNIKEEHIKKWFLKRLTTYLMTKYKNITEILPSEVNAHFLNKEVPLVIKKAIENEEKIYKFNKNSAFISKMSEVVDYLKHLESKSINITGMDFEIAYKKSKEWHKNFSKPNKRKLTKNIEGLKILKDFENGCFLAEILSKEQFSYESKMMSHCVESYYGRNYSKIITYRTSENKPLLTMELVFSDKSIVVVQAKGFGNKGFIQEEHIKNVLNYLYSFNIYISYQDCLIFGNLISGRPMLSLEDGLILKSPHKNTAIEIECCVGIPKNTIFKNSLKLKEAQFPILRDIKVEGNLYIENSLTVAILETVSVEGDIFISKSLTSIIPESLQNKIKRI